jgi:Asp-tRNA(Asn)/Glu-tRNA(Gln) amidotransferase A subunit family amidase
MFTRAALALFAVAVTGCSRQSPPAFHLQEATIEGIQTAIMSGDVSCRAVVEAYINRARAYNGVCTSLVTADGTPVPAAKGAVRAGAPLTFPTQTVAASEVFPDLDRYAGLPLDFGRMESTVSDPTVMQQAGMRVGIPNAGQVNALETLNIRGERSVTCKGVFDAHPSTGPLPPGAPPECEAFRRQPDALERASELDAQYGRNADLAAMPMYCITVAFKDPYDTKDMRSTSGNDVAFGMDAPPFDSTIAGRLREKGAIIYAKTTSHEFNAGPNDPGTGRPAKARTNYVNGGQAVSSWSGQACNPYDTERVPRGSSSGSGVAVAANLVTVAVCEQTVASCQGPASRNNATLLLPTKGHLPDSGGIGNQSVTDRPGIIARTLEDGARVLDALRDPAAGYFDSRDPFTALPKGLISNQPYIQNLVRDLDVNGDRPLEGMRIAILREHMVTPTANHMAISRQIDQEIKKVLRDRLGAELVETITPEYPDDPDVPNLKYAFSDAFSETLPRFMPEIFSRRTPSGELVFTVPGHQVDSYEYLLKLSRREAPLSNAIRIDTIGTIAGLPNALDFRFEMDRYLASRGDRTITNWDAWVAHARFRDDVTRADSENWRDTKTNVSAGKAGRLAIGQVGRTVLLEVMRENGIDLFVHPENTVPTPKILGPNVGPTSLDGITPLLGVPRVVVPAGYNRVIYEPRFALSPDRTNYISVLPEGTPESQLPHPMPIAITFFAAQGDEPTLLKAASAYEAATKHRVPPPAFGPVAGEPQPLPAAAVEAALAGSDGRPATPSSPGRLKPAPTTAKASRPRRARALRIRAANQKDCRKVRRTGRVSGTRGSPHRRRTRSRSAPASGCAYARGSRTRSPASAP